MFFFVLLINMMRFVSQTTFRQFPSLLLNGTCGSRLWPTQRGVWFPSPVPRCCRGRGGWADRRTKQQARGGWLLALCAPSRLPIAFIAGACGKQWPCCQVPAWDTAPARAALGHPTHRLWGPPTGSAHRRHHCHPRWMGRSQAQGLVPWPPAPAPRGYAGPGCGGAGLHTAGLCPWSWPGGRGEGQVTRPLGETPPQSMKPPARPGLGVGCLTSLVNKPWGQQTEAPVGAGLALPTLEASCSPWPGPRAGRPVLDVELPACAWQPPGLYRGCSPRSGRPSRPGPQCPWP